jgi:hypothetical protein
MMSENKINFTVAGVELTMNEQVNPAIPSWLPEALLVAQYWQSHGLLEILQTQIRVSRGRMGNYEVCDFVLLLLAYSVSGLDSLQEFFAQLKCVSTVLMSVWGRQKCPVASTLSRFLRDIDQAAVEALRDLFETDLGQNQVSCAKELGLKDRNGKQWAIFDADGTVKTVRHRVLNSQKTHPTLKRRSDDACKPGYKGSKRGEAIRSRTTIENAHTREWLGSFAGAGNGSTKEDLKQSCDVIARYCCSLDMSEKNALLRLDGLYGSANYISILQQQKMMYITRCKDYHLLKNPQVKAHLAGIPYQQYIHPDSPDVIRELFDIDHVDATERGYLDPLRLIVLRLIRFSDKKPTVGKCEGKYLYEVFLTSLPVNGFSASDVLSIYNGRGGFEQTLSEEDKEQDCDHWCSWQPEGQSFWQILSQWVWNWRIRAGWQSQSTLEVRQTLWSPALEVTEIEAYQMKMTPVHAESFDNTPLEIPLYGKMIATPSRGKSRYKYSEKDFKVMEEECVECPAGHPMARQETRFNDLGDMKLVFGVLPTVCRDCPLIQKCHANGSKNSRGRRILFTKEKLDPPKVVMPVVAKPCSTIVTLGREAVIWTDLPATEFRRKIKCNLERNKIEIESISNQVKTKKILKILTRDQRAHRRLSWEKRIKCNELKGDEFCWKVQLFGISSALAKFLDRPQDMDCEHF